MPCALFGLLWPQFHFSPNTGPWDGSYNVSDTVWVVAHTTQFTEKGWRYVGGAGCGLLEEGGSYVSYVSSAPDLTIVIETVSAKNQQSIDFKLEGALAGLKDLFVWKTSKGSVFQKANANIPVIDGVVSVQVPPDSVFTVTEAVMIVFT